MSENEPKPPDAVALPAPRLTLGVRLKALLEEYGRLAVVIYLVLFALVFGGFAGALALGVKIESTAGGAGLVGAAWLATKLTQPLRILATLALVPIVARVQKRRRA